MAATDLANLTPTQLENANAIIQIGNQLGESQQNILIALMIADFESNFNPTIKNSDTGSSAYGLFQYNNDTWSDEFPKAKKNSRSTGSISTASTGSDSNTAT